MKKQLYPTESSHFPPLHRRNSWAFAVRTFYKYHFHTSWLITVTVIYIFLPQKGYIGHEKNSTTILSLPLIQEGQCQLLAKEWAQSTGKLPRRLVLEQRG